MVIQYDLAMFAFFMKSPRKKIFVAWCEKIPKFKNHLTNENERVS